MLYYLFDFLNQTYDLPGAGVFQYITFRAAMAVITSLLISMVFGKRLIDRLHRLQVGETVRDLGLEGQQEKSGTPTMGESSSLWQLFFQHYSGQNWTIYTSSLCL